jgi:hypothetical protein
MSGIALRHAAFVQLPRWLRLAVAVLVLGAALAAAVIYSHRVAYGSHGCPPNAPVSCVPGPYHIRPGWVGPTALGIALLGVALAVGVLVTARRTAH